MNEARSRAFALEWIEAWNSHDLDRILGHYSEDIAVTSPFVASVLGDGKATVHGKPALRDYWATALHRYGDLRFHFFRAYPGVDSIVIHYRSVAGLLGMEFMRFDDQGLVCEVRAHYAAEADELAA